MIFDLLHDGDHHTVAYGLCAVTLLPLSVTRFAHRVNESYITGELVVLAGLKI
jgi:hypothetical protein